MTIVRGRDPLPSEDRPYTLGEVLAAITDAELRAATEERHARRRRDHWEWAVFAAVVLALIAVAYVAGRMG